MIPGPTKRAPRPVTDEEDLEFPGSAEHDSEYDTANTDFRSKEQDLQTVTISTAARGTAQSSHMGNHVPADPPTGFKPVSSSTMHTIYIYTFLILLLYVVRS